MSNIKVICEDCGNIYNQSYKNRHFLSKAHNLHIKTSSNQFIMDKNTLNNNNKLITLLQMDNLSITGESPIYENQQKIADDVLNAFKIDEILNVMVIARTQSGKTGSMCSTVKKLLEDSTFNIPITNIFIITGLSSVEWKEQTKGRMPDIMNKRVFHRNELTKKFVSSFKTITNALIIMDEVHIASFKEQTIYLSFKEIGLLNKNFLISNSIKILEFSATPNGTLYDLMRWKKHGYKIIAEPGKGYISSIDLLNQNRVFQFKPLNSKDLSANLQNITSIKNIIVCKYLNNPLYHIIRTNHSIEQTITINNFKKIFEDVLFEYLTFDIQNKKVDINTFLNKKPLKHTFIFIKEKLRCAKTINREHIGILYERCVSYINDTNIIQGLLGRMTGYGDNKISICFTNIDTIHKYEELYLNGFSNLDKIWNVSLNSSSFNNPDYYENFDEIEKEVLPVKETHFIDKFFTFKEVESFYLNKIVPKIHIIYPKYTPYSMLKEKIPNENGFFMHNYNKQQLLLSTKNAITHSKKGLSNLLSTELSTDLSINNTNSKIHFCRIIPCYEDVNDNSTLQWWVVHKLI